MLRCLFCRSELKNLFCRVSLSMLGVVSQCIMPQSVEKDAKIYGAYHGRFTQERHPVNKSWVNAKNGLAFLLDMTWEEFNHFNQAALPEYLDLLAEDLRDTAPNAGVLIDGGIMRGTDAFKAIALGADAVCVGRAYGYGLAAYGDPGVAAVMQLLQAELVRIMQLAGAPSLSSIQRSHVQAGG